MAGVVQPANFSDIRYDIPELKGDNYKIWKERVLLHLGWMDIDYAIRKDEPPALTDTSIAADIALYERWERSNRLSMMFIKTRISAGIRGSVDQHEKVRDLLKAIDEQFVTSDKALASTLIMKFSSLRLTSGKQTNKSKKGANRSSDILEIIHTDICSPDMDSHGQKYFISFIDDYSRYMYLYMLYNKNEALDAFKIFKAEVEKQCGKQIKIVRSDRGGEYYGRYTEDGQAPGPFAKFLQEHGIVAQYTMLGSPDQNGVAERRKPNIIGHGAEVCLAAPIFLNPCWKPSLRDMHVWGCPFEVRVYNPQEKKLDPRTINGYFIGYAERSIRPKRSTIPDDYVVYLQESDYNIGAENDPEFFSQAMSCKESELWYNAMKEEMNSMKSNGVWDLVELPNGVKAIGCKWVFKTKKDSLGNIERYKARLVAKGFTQKEGIDYTETFSPVSKKDSLRVILALVAHFDLELQQMDVKTVFFNGDLEEEVYIKQPEGFPSSDGEQLVCKLKKSIYGLKQASRQWSAQDLTLHLLVGMLGRYQSDPGLDHWRAAKKVMRYLQGTKDYMLMYRRTEQSGRYIFLMANGAISWRSAKQTLIATSTMEAEFVSCFEATSHGLLVFMAKNNKSGSRSKHIDIKYLAIRERIKEKKVVIEHVSTELMIADLLTKGMPSLKFKDHVAKMGLGSIM
uniref:Integrase catalytic domain-containing protein n=1 Tax=Fagus sylvatica TaxID=28930 RepID=A0A2N9G0L4_FAGSY